MQQERLTRAAILRYNTTKKKVGYCSPNSANRYCSNRLTRNQFIAIHVTLVSLLLFFIIVPLFYMLIVPALIRDKVRDLDLSQTIVKRMNLDNFQKDAFSTSIHVIVPPQFPIPLSASIAPFVIKISLAADALPQTERHTLIEMHFPQIDVSIHKDIEIKVDDALSSYKDTDQEYLQQFLLVQSHHTIH